MKRTWAAVQNLSVAVGVPVCLLALVELGGRLVLPDTPPNTAPALSASEVADPQLLWRNRPGSPDLGTEGPINSLGLRGPEVPLHKPTGIYRILSLGESTSYGHNLSWRDTYAHQLEEQLTAKGYPVQVLNAGVRAWSTYQSVRYLQLEGARLEPDMVLFYHEVNDFLPTTFRGIDLPGAGLTDEELVWRIQHAGWLERLLAHSRVYNFLRLSYARWLLHKAYPDRHTKGESLTFFRLPYENMPVTPPGMPRPWMDNRNPMVRVPDPQRVKALRELIDWTRQHHVQLVLLHPAYPTSRPHRCLLTQLAAEQGVPLLDVEDVIWEWAMRTNQPMKALFQPLDVFHLSALGNDVLAQALAEFLKQRGLLPPLNPRIARAQE